MDSTVAPVILLLVTSEACRWLEAKDIPDTAPYGDNLLVAMNDGRDYEPFVQCARSKLLVMYTSQSLAELTTKDNGEVEVIATAVCPGACKSDLMRDLQGRSYSVTITLSIFHTLFEKPTEQGARSYIWASLLGSGVSQPYEQRTTSVSLCSLCYLTINLWVPES